MHWSGSSRPTALPARPGHSSRLGDTARATGELTMARTHYTETLRVFHETQDSKNEVSALYRIGGLAAATGDLSTARTSYQAGLDIAQRLAAADPANAQWQPTFQLAKSTSGM